MRKIIRYLKESRRLVLIITWLKMLSYKFRPRNVRSVIFCPSASGRGSASDLRAWSLMRPLARHGWRAFCIHPKLSLRDRLKIISTIKPRFLILQQTRHDLNDPSLYNVQCILDVDDADIHDPKHRERITSVAEKCAGIIAGSRYLADQFRSYNSCIEVVWTGTYLRPISSVKPNIARGRSIAWATSDPLGYPIEFAFFLDIIASLAINRSDFMFSIFGVKNDQADAVHELIKTKVPCHVAYTLHAPMAYKKLVRTLGEYSVGVQPVLFENEFSRGKSFGKILAYLVSGVTVIASDEVDHGLFFRHRENGLLVQNQVSEWVAEIDFLLSNPAERMRMSSEASRDLEAHLTDVVAAQKVAKFLDQLS